VFLEKRHGVCGAEHPTGDFKCGAAKGARGTSGGAIGVFVVTFWKQQFAGTDAGEHIFKERGVALFDCEFTGGEFDGGYSSAEVVPCAGDPCGGNSICAGIIKQGFVNQGSR
jgi:hypothetical protein